MIKHSLLVILSCIGCQKVKNVHTFNLVVHTFKHIYLLPLVHRPKGALLVKNYFVRICASHVWVSACTHGHRACTVPLLNPGSALFLVRSARPASHCLTPALSLPCFCLDLLCPGPALALFLSCPAPIRTLMNLDSALALTLKWP